MKGRRVDPAETVDGVTAILEGKCDGLREDQLFMIGSLDEAIRGAGYQFEKRQP
jgi:F0F1-type ATP synthase beta subunit